jgi:dihydrofolate reductase
MMAIMAARDHDGKVFFSVSMSLDGYSAPVSMDALLSTPEQREQDPRLDRWLGQWMELQAWLFPLRFFRENLTLGQGGEEGLDNDIARHTFERTGSSVMGKRMFDLGEASWPDDPPFHTPVFVLTHEKRDPWEREGGTTFHFVNDGIDSALEQARDAAGERDVRIAGGSDAIVQYLNAGLVDEFSLAVSPVLFGAGTRLFDNVDAAKVAIEPVRSEASKRVTHLTYAVRER